MSESETDCAATNANEETEVNDSPDSNNPSVQNPTDNKDERPSCKFGRKCFRQNQMHRLDMAHPGDTDYIISDMPEPSEDAVKCKYGRKCYRLNPEHFRNFMHPRNINIQQNYIKYVLKRQSNRRNSDSSFESNDSDYDPFAGDSGGSDYVPSDED